LIKDFDTNQSNNNALCRNRWVVEFSEHVILEYEGKLRLACASKEQ